MSLADVLMAVAVLLVSAWLARRAAPRAQLALWASALLMSAAMFLPSSLLRALIGAELLLSLESMVGALHWALADVVHFIAFAWFAMVLWTLRPDLRGWRAVAVLLVLAVAAELLQGLTIERSARLVDVALNLLGAGAGLVLAIVFLALWKTLPARDRESRLL